MSSRNPMKDRVAIAAAATTGFVNRNTERSQASLAAEACVAALRACGLRAGDVDGICGSFVPATHMQAMLGIPDVTWFANPVVPFGNQLAAATSAVFSGLCDVVIAYHPSYRLPWNTSSAAKDPYRRMPGGTGFGGGPGPETLVNAPAYAAWAGRYLHDFGATRKHFGYVAINDRTNAAQNPAAALKTPITMDDYFAARMVREPLGLLDMDLPVDGADAFVITTVERARDLPNRPVLVHAVSLGVIDRNDEDQTPSLARNGQHVVVEALRAKSDFWVDDCDIFLPYDGFTVITLNWLENMGWCGRGEAGPFIEQNWVANADGTGRILINGRIPVNPHGGSLSEGATQSSGHLREAVHQLQGLAGERQVQGAERVIVGSGGFFFNSQGWLLRVD